VNHPVNQGAPLLLKWLPRRHKGSGGGGSSRRNGSDHRHQQTRGAAGCCCLLLQVRSLVLYSYLGKYNNDWKPSVGRS